MRDDPASVDVYLRAEGYYLVTSAKTTEGLWQHVPELPTFLAHDTAASAIGREARARLAKARPRTRHPAESEWSEVRKEFLAPILRAAKVRSWRAFITGTSVVDVSRVGGVFIVHPEKAVEAPHGSFEPDISNEVRLHSPTMLELGQAILHTFTFSTPA